MRPTSGRRRADNSNISKNIRNGKKMTVSGGARQILHKRIRTGNKSGRTQTYNQKLNKGTVSRTSKTFGRSITGKRSK